jgi:hypothetical protein
MDRIVSDPRGLGKVNVGMLSVIIGLLLFWAAFAAAVWNLT